MIPELEPLPTEAPSGDIRSRLLRYLVALVLVTTGAIVAIIAWTATQTVEDLSENLIERSTDHTDEMLRAFVARAEDQLRAARGWERTIGLANADEARLNRLFLPLLETHEAHSAVLLADDSGREYMLMRQADGWSTRRRLGDPHGGAARLWSWSDTPGLEGVEATEQTLQYDPRSRPWFEGAIHALERGREGITWTKPYRFFTAQEPGITASLAWRDDAGTHVLGLDVLLRDVSRFTSSLEVSPRGFAAVLDEGGRVVGLPRGAEAVVATDVEEIPKPGEIGVPALASAFEAWSATQRTGAVFSLDAGGETWWAGFRSFSLDPERRLDVGVVIPEADLRGNLDLQRNLILAVAALALIGAVILALRLNRAVDEQVESAVEKARTLGQYTLLRKVGQGGIGAVYHARHSMLRRPCAVKVLRPQKAQDEVALARFEREVQATAELSHPNTISIYDYGRTPDGVFYYAMEYLRGISLYQLISGDGPQPPARVIHILRQMCGSLAEAHESGLVHRDIKPGNVMLCERGGVRDFVKVLDFGLVKNVEERDGDLTQAGALFGTPSYLSPEGIGSPDDVGPPSDLYAVGVVGYFLITGTVPFRGESMMDVLKKHLEEEPVRPSDRLGQPLPDDLQDAILACLAKKPGDRPPSARVLGARLAACADADTWDVDDADSWWARYPELLADPDEPSEAEIQSMAVDLRGRRGS